MITKALRSALALLLLVLFAACGEKRLTQGQVKEKLENAWTRHLQEHKSPNKPQPHFDVLDVVYYEDSTFYLCQFKVKMTLPTGQDTTGTMQGKVTKDFSTIF
jgi:hypothetical protein